MLVSAPTSMGKTLIAEAAIFEALTTRRRLYYTTPLIALTDHRARPRVAPLCQSKSKGVEIWLPTSGRGRSPPATWPPCRRFKSAF